MDSATDPKVQAEQFERHRAHLRAVAYRMLGSVTEADDAVQEAWLRLSRTDGDAIDNMAGWLTTVVGRVCIDMLRARRSRREDFVGTWLPEPIVSVEQQTDPEQESLLADSVGLALLVVLETLTPAERLSFVLHDTFGVPFEQIAPMIDRTPAAARQLASRARRRVRGAPTVPDADLAKQRAVVDAFLAASRGGDFDTLLRLLDPDVVFRADSGLGPVLAPPMVAGRDAVARTVAAQGPRYMPYCTPAVVNGAAGLVVRAPGRQPGVIGITVIDGRITEIDLILDEDKLRNVVLGE
jgi:RNA polymerase sigma-70 factor (ECF subfamily)